MSKQCVLLGNSKRLDGVFAQTRYDYLPLDASPGSGLLMWRNSGKLLYSRNKLIVQNIGGRCPPFNQSHI
jgi:hypothetical protein